MDIKQIKNKKLQLECDIQKLIITFVKETELEIANIEMVKFKDFDRKVLQYNIGIDILI